MKTYVIFIKALLQCARHVSRYFITLSGFFFFKKDYQTVAWILVKNTQACVHKPILHMNLLDTY